MQLDGAAPNFFNSIADGGGLMFTMPDIWGVMADVATLFEAISAAKHSFRRSVRCWTWGRKSLPQLSIRKTSLGLWHQAKFWRGFQGSL